jgi:site-specific DNA recombinase
MGRAVIYTRVSSLAQEDGYSLEAQEKDGREYCRKHGHTVEAVESDTFSGHDTMDEREGMQRAIRLIRHGEVDTLVIWRIDRANRFSIDNLLLLRDVSEAGGAFASVSEGVIPNSAMGRFMLSAHSFAAENEWEGIRDRTQRGLTERIGRGHILVAPVPLYGYVWDGDRKQTYVVDPDAGPVVQLIYDKSEAGWASRRIARYLNEQGIPTASLLLYRRGELPASRKVAKEWSASMVIDVLTNESYTGKHSARRYTTTKVKVERGGRTVTIRRRHIRAESDERRVSLTIPALITAEQWASVQDQLKSRHVDWEEETDAPLLSRGIAYCGACEARMVTVQRKDWAVRRYMCSYRATTCPGHGHALKADEVDRDVWEKAKDIVRDEERFTRLVEGKSAKLAQRHAEAVQRAEAAARELEETTALRETVYRRMMTEKDDTIYAMHHAELERLNKVITAAQKRVDEEQGAAEEAQGKRDVHKALLAGIAASARHLARAYGALPC